jgi:very-short-patch-repair endonuclease
MPSINDDPSRPWESRVDKQFNIAGGLKSVDAYLPDWDLVIEFDGPSHFFQPPNERSD